MVVGEFIINYEGEFIGRIHDSVVVKIPMLKPTKQMMMDCFEMKGIELQSKVIVF